MILIVTNNVENIVSSTEQSETSETYISMHVSVERK